MPSLISIRGVLNAELLRMLRDKFLIGITIYLLFVFVVIRLILSAEVAEGNKELIPHIPLIFSYFVVQIAPMIPGIIGGFLLLESREEGAVKALMVAATPLPTYLSIVNVAMFAAAFLLTLLGGAIIGVGLPPWPALCGIALAGAPAGPLFALLIAAIANNKVQAFACMKLYGLGPFLVVGAWFMPDTWQWLVAIYPPYWATKAYWVAEAGGAWLPWTLGGVITSTIWIGALRRLFLRAARK
ncbi:hypothetical protein N8612_04255 [Verrucomicrobia bacterium]|jgi:fluoroquinolone transport system permease protein|nr:hypothetical protein [Verrucomicrobiota bacterium]